MKKSFLENYHEKEELTTAYTKTPGFKIAIVFETIITIISFSALLLGGTLNDVLKVMIFFNIIVITMAFIAYVGLTLEDKGEKK